MTRDDKPKRLCFLRSQKTMIVRAMRGAAPSAVFAVCALAGAQVALADEPDRVQIGFDTSGPGQSGFETRALTPEELTGVRGAGLDSGPPKLDNGTNTAVILFDEAGSKRSSGASKTASFDAGVGTRISSTTSARVD